jgi:hypothetical protein
MNKTTTLQTTTKRKQMRIVNTPEPEGVVQSIPYARTAEGKINCKAYRKLNGIIHERGLSIGVRIIDARVRYGHLDLKVTPVKGAGEIWIERKNIVIPKDPALTKNSKRRVEIHAKRSEGRARVSVPAMDAATTNS